MHVHEWGHRGDPVVLCLHKNGATADGTQFAATGDALVNRYGLHVLAPDAPGYGRSSALSPERYRLPELARMWLSLLVARGIERAAVIGSSWGAGVAGYLAAVAPARVAALVLLDGGHVDYRTLFGSYELTLEQARKEPSASNVEGEVSLDVLAAVRFAVVHDPASATWPGLASVPTLLLIAGEPPERRAPEWEERFAAAVPHAEVRVLEDWPHDMPAHDGEELAEMLGSWLRARF